MKYVVCFISDRADLYLPAARRSVTENLSPRPDNWHVIDDRDHFLGMAGAVRAGFEWALSEDADFVYWHEEDFLLNGPINLEPMATILDACPHLSQMALKRQPWSPEEVATGGFMEGHPSEYLDHAFTTADGEPLPGLEWVETRRNFTLNPCLIPRRTLIVGWPDDNEAGMTTRLLERGMSFGFYGRAADPPRVTHVGVQRASGWRL